MKLLQSKYLFYSLIFLLSSSVFGQHATGYMPLPEGKYEETRIPFMSSGNQVNLPENYVISESYFPTPGSQGNYGSCVAWSTGYAFASFYFSVKNKWGKPEDQSKIMSPAYIYNSIRECNCGPTCGTYITDALDLLKTKGVVPWQSMPYSDKSCNMPASNLHNVASNYKIKGYNRLQNKLNFNEYKQYLSNDVPVIIGVPLGKGFDNFSPSTAGSTFKCTQLTSGGHAMLLVGYDDTKKAFKIMNSWGKDWGDKGHIWVDYDCFKLMMSGNGGEAYVVSKDYEIPNSTDPVIEPTPTPVDNTNLVVTDEMIIPFGYSEEIETDHFYIAYGIVLDPSIQNEIDRVVYVFDDPDFANKYVTSKEAPYFSTAYEGPFCLEEMKAYVYFKNGSRHLVTFDGCEVLNYDEEEGDEDYENKEDESGYIVVTPIVTATPVTSNPGTYTFEIRLRGLDPIKEHISKIVYNYNHSSFSNPFVTVSDNSNGYKTAYTGWGCLKELIATIYYTDGTSDSIEIDMCSELGW